MSRSLYLRNLQTGSTEDATPFFDLDSLGESEVDPDGLDPQVLHVNTTRVGARFITTGLDHLLSPSPEEVFFQVLEAEDDLDDASQATVADAPEDIPNVTEAHDAWVIDSGNANPGDQVAFVMF